MSSPPKKDQQDSPVFELSDLNVQGQSNDDNIRVVSENISQTGKVSQERQYFVYTFVLFFAITGLALLAISVWGTNSLIQSSAMDFFKLWLGALISIVSVMSTFYFRQESK